MRAPGAQESQPAAGFDVAGPEVDFVVTEAVKEGAENEPAPDQVEAAAEECRDEVSDRLGEERAGEARLGTDDPGEEKSEGEEGGDAQERQGEREGEQEEQTTFGAAREENDLSLARARDDRQGVGQGLPPFGEDDDRMRQHRRGNYASAQRQTRAESAANFVTLRGDRGWLTTTSGRIGWRRRG